MPFVPNAEVYTFFKGHFGTIWVNIGSKLGHF